MEELPLIEQKGPTKFPGSIDLRHEEDKADKQCAWIMEREPSKGKRCKNIVFKEGDEYCAKHKAISVERAKKLMSPPVDPFQVISNPVIEVDDDIGSYEDELPQDVPKKVVNFSSEPQSNIPDFLKSDQDIIDILRGLVMIRVRLAGLASK
jgi:hypothetical protein